VEPVTKTELVKVVADKTGMTQKEAAKAVAATFESIRSALAKGEKVQLVGFGGFEVRQRASRQGRNPRTGKKLRIQARRVPAFRAGKPLREAVTG
jgi:DNA-binding protein HU-beta